MNPHQQKKIDLNVSPAGSLQFEALLIDLV
jgi:hypothetical protein